MHSTDWATFGLLVLAVLGIVGAAVGWFFRRGADERELALAMHANTKATDRLTEKVEFVVGTLNDHEVRLSVHEVRLSELENRPPRVEVTQKIEAQNVDSASLVRDARTAGGYLSR